MTAYNLCVTISRTLSQEGTLVSKVGLETVSLQVAGKCSLADIIKHLSKLKDNTPGMVSD